MVLIEVAAGNDLELMERAGQRRIDLVATDSAHFALARNLYPTLQEAHPLPDAMTLSWAFPANTDRQLVERANAFIAKVGRDSTLDRLADRYFGHANRLPVLDVNVFGERIRTLLPRYREAFMEAGERVGMDWRMLAALAYQESHWNPAAESPTGVRGLMMLTEETAARLNVSDPLDPMENIDAGARYLADLRAQLPPEVAEPDRSWLALAAYNLGMRHVQSARAIAGDLGREPNSWYDMKSVLPLLSKPDYAKQLKSRGARGHEAVAMVESVRVFYDLLCRHDRPAAPPPRR
jgi:membrane-bound lytic murein transglycosylase F